MQEMQITPEQFEVACLAGKHSATGISFHQGLFQQVYLIMMIMMMMMMDFVFGEKLKPFFLDFD